MELGRRTAGTRTGACSQKFGSTWKACNFAFLEHLPRVNTVLSTISTYVPFIMHMDTHVQFPVITIYL